ncbi:hypothetical protein [Nostoc sp. LPT]|uniref:hypothetical protein n=1 Tax=Nostoc sp. LPT TaxID=2815387 RepID=UPI001E14F03F|nr:hypothetical protein [Nostoc sp. LPT]MBN4003862.1 hypothetical protein [Nostoc sp. LPT]
MDIQEYFNGVINNQQLNEMLNQQHYTFAHKIMPYIVENNFQELVSKVIDKSAQDWILQLWNKCSGIQNYNYTSLIYPICNFTRHSEDIGLIYIAMPAPRVSPEAAYIAVIFLIDDDLPSDWLRSYFTLELGLAASAYWTLGEWDNSNHINLGNFKAQPNLNNFLTTVIAEIQSRWC